MINLNTPPFKKKMLNTTASASKHLVFIRPISPLLIVPYRVLNTLYSNTPHSRRMATVIIPSSVFFLYFYILSQVICLNSGGFRLPRSPTGWTPKTERASSAERSARSATSFRVTLAPSSRQSVAGTTCTWATRVRGWVFVFMMCIYTIYYIIYWCMATAVYL